MTSAAFRSAAAPARAGTGQAGWLSGRAYRNAGLMTPGMPATPAGFPLAGVGHVLAVTARPGQESAELGGLLYAFRRAGARVALLCLTRGEASPLNSTCERLETIRPFELQVAAGIVGISSVMVADFPDGGLSRSPVPELTGRVRRAIGEHEPDLVLVTDPAAGSPDDARVAQAACLAAQQAGVPVAARTVPGAWDSWPLDLGAQTAAARAVQRSAAAAHASQSAALTQLGHRLDLLDGQEHLRWLVPPAAVASCDLLARGQRGSSEHDDAGDRDRGGGKLQREPGRRDS